MTIRRTIGGEVRAEGRRLVGIVMRYGDVSPSHRERFEPGALRLAEAVHLDLHHDRDRAVAWHPGGGLELVNGKAALTMRAELPPIPAAARAMAEVRAGRVNGLSVEFRPLKERQEGNLRVIEDAVLNGIGLVRSPSYGESVVEARAKSGRTLTAKVPLNRDLQCECIAQRGPGTGAVCAGVVRFEEEVAKPMAAMIDRAFQDAQKGIDGRDVLAVAKDYSNPIASARRGTLRAAPAAGALNVVIDLPAGRVGDDVVAASETAGVIVRPLIDYEAEDTRFVDTPDARVVEEAHLRAFLVGSTDSREGWPDAVISYEGERQARQEELFHPRETGYRRRTPRWL